MIKIFALWSDFEDLEIRYNLIDCGMSGLHPGYHWFQDDKAGIAIYVK
jgi:hypothetical protein